MIRPLRQRHRALVCSLGLLMPLAFATGIAVRRPAPVTQPAFVKLAQTTAAFRDTLWTKTDLWPHQRITTTLRREPAGAMAVELMYHDLIKPDVLVYWVSGKETREEGLPEEARFLGALVDRGILPLPSDMSGESGRLMLYSLAEHEVVAASTSFVVEKN